MKLKHKYQIRMASPGYAVGRIQGPASFKEGSILFIPNMDRDYMEKVFSSKGVVARVGSSVAHMASVCRELNIPAAVFNDPDNVLKDGLEVLLNADEGELYVFD